MNASALRRIVEEDSQPVFVAPPSLSDFHRGHEVAMANPRLRVFGIGFAVTLHVLLIAGFLIAGPSIVKVIQADLTFVSLQPQKLSTVDLPPPPKLEAVVPPQVDLPDIIVDTPPPPSAITAAPPKPVVAAPTPSLGDNKTYFSRLLAKLYSYKRYPEAARIKREKGVAIIRIVMERDGTVTGVTLVKSSGSDALDQESLALPMRAQPLPAMPDSMPQERLTMNVNVDFTRVN